MCSKSDWDKAQESLEGVRPYEDGYNKESVHRLIDEGNKLLESCKRLHDECNHVDYENTLLKAELKDSEEKWTEYFTKSMEELRIRKEKLEAIRQIVYDYREECQRDPYAYIDLGKLLEVLDS